MQDGFDFSELTKLKDKIHKVNKLFPDESKEFLKEEAKELNKIAKKIAKREVGTSKDTKKNWNEKKSYHKRFKVGKSYKYAENDVCIRVYNSSRHGHLIENGYIHTGHEPDKKKGEFVVGKQIIKKSENEYTPKFISNTEEFLGRFVKDAVEGK